MAIIQKSSFAQHLDTYKTFITDTVEFSRYFKISQLPDTFTGGKNAFLVQGSPELADGTYLMIEIKDSRGKVIYTEPAGGKPSNYYEGTSKPVAIHIYPDTTYGPCTITILGELKEYELNGVKYPIPNNWVGRPNVKWQKKVNVNATLANTTPVRFYKRPTIQLTERLLPVYILNSTFTNLSGSLYGLSISPEDGTRYPYNDAISYYITSGNPADFVYYIPPVTRPYYGAYPSSSAVPFPNGLIGKTLTISNINNKYSSSENPRTFQTKITQLNGLYNAYVDMPFLRTIPGTNKQEYADIGYGEWRGVSEEIILTQSGISASYINVKISNLDTFSGDAYRLKVWSKSRSTIKDYQLIEDRLIEPVELLQDDFYLNTINPKTGIFIDNAFLNNYWKIQSLDVNGNNLELDTDRLGFAKIWPVSQPANSTGLIKFEPAGSSLFTAGTEYQLTFDSVFLNGPNGIGILDVYVSGSLPNTGSAFINTNNTFGKKVLSLNASGFRDYGTQTLNFKADSGFDGYGKLTFNVLSGNWDLANISLKPSKQSAFTPNEISFLINPNIQVVSESFDFRVELFDINYNYIPVKLDTFAQFGGGNNIVPSFRVTQPTNPTFSLDASGYLDPTTFIDIPYQTVVATDPVIFYSSSYGTSYTYPNAYSRNRSVINATQDDPINYPNEWDDITTDYWYPGRLTNQIPQTTTATGTNGTKRIYWSDFSSSLKGTELPYGKPDVLLNYVPRSVERVKYYVTCGTLPAQTVEIYADYSGITTTTSTTTTSTTTTSTTTTSTSTSTTTTTPIPGNVVVTIRNQTLGRTISNVNIDGNNVILDNPYSFPINAGGVATFTIPNNAAAAVQVTIPDAINGENLFFGDAPYPTSATQVNYFVDGIAFLSSQFSSLNQILLEA
jgi:hypothetical protein